MGRFVKEEMKLMTKFFDERKFEKIMLGDPAKMHDLVNYNYDERKFEFTLTICRSDNSGNSGPTKKFKFKNVDDFQFEIIDAKDLEELVTPIIGIDNYKETNSRQKVVINCNAIEFIFKTDKEPEEVV